MVTLGIMILGFLAGRIFPARHKGKNEKVQLFFTLLLIFTMGVSLGQREGFFSELLGLGLQSFVFFLIPTLLSVAVVFPLTRHFMKGSGGQTEPDIMGDAPEAPSKGDPMVFLALGSLILGILFGSRPALAKILSPLTLHSDWLLYLLMFSVGISVGLHRGLLSQLRRNLLKTLIVPVGIILGSLAGGIVCGMLLHFPLNQSVSIAGGMGWYSLAGVTIGNLAGASLGSIAFLSNLMREIGAFFMIPFLSRHCNAYTCIAPAAATSEDTTLPMLIRYTNEETVVFAVLNGIICSAVVPVIISFCY